MSKNNVKSFFKVNPALSYEAVESESGVSKGTLRKFLYKGEDIKDSDLFLVKRVIKKYGYYDRDGAKVISIVNNKGGVAKTTTCSNLGRALWKKGCKVLMLDMDQQGNLSQIYEIDQPDQELYESLSFAISAPLKNCIMEIEEGFDICPSSISLGQASLDLQNNQLAGYKRMSSVLDEVRNEYDYILIDCPPALDILTSTSLVASDSVLLPVQPEEHAVKGLKNVFNLIDQMKDLNDKIYVEGIIFTLVTLNTTLHKSYMDSIIEGMPNVRVFDSVVRRSISIPEATATKQTVLDYDIDSNGAKDYLSLAKEILG